MSDLEFYNSRLRNIESMYEQCPNKSGATAAALNEEYRKVHEERLAFCEDALDKSEKLYDAGSISYAQFNEAYETIKPMIDESTVVAYPYYTEAVTGKAFAIALDELARLSGNITKFIPANLFGVALTMPAKKFINGRLSKYPLLHQDAVAFKQLDHQVYSMNEVRDKFNINMDFAEDWQSKGLRTTCKVYFYNKKPVMVIAYIVDFSKLSGNTNVMTKILDSSFKKHDDYYNACMCTQIQLSHPSIMRVLNQMKADWKRETQKMEKEVKESVEESLQNFTFGEKLELVEEAVENDFLARHEADTYIKLLRKYANE